MHEEDAMRSGTPWRLAVLASLALMLSGQLCMLTTCVPRLTHLRSAAHSCCRATPAPSAPAQPLQAPGAMPCDILLHGADGPSLAAASPLSMPAALVPAASSMLAPPARVAPPVADADTGAP